jgi:YjbE family integral membrane protein
LSSAEPSFLTAELAETLYSIAVIIVVNLVLSGDNAVVIGMAAHRLPPRERRIAIVLGGVAAIVLRVILTVVAARLLQIPGLQIVGGLLLIWIGFKLLKEEEESAEGVKIATTMREAVLTILVADLIMSTDNVLGVAAASRNNYDLLVFGLVVSMAIILWMGSIIASLINRIFWLSYVGAAVIIWTGSLMIFDDPLIKQKGWFSQPVEYISAAAITLAVTSFAHWFHRVRESS